jgi:hypothetical protein
VVGDEGTVPSGLTALAGDGRQAFFALLVKDLSITIRALYAESRDNGTDIRSQLAGVGEVLHAIGNKLCADAGLGGAPDDAAFLAALITKADYWGLGGGVRRGIRHAAKLSVQGRRQITVARPLNERERDVLVHLLHNAPPDYGVPLLSQVDSAAVVGEGLGWTNFHANEGDSAPQPEHGPVPMRAVVEDEGGRIVGELLIWTKAGYLSALEHAWFTDEPPRELPPVQRIRIGEH